MTQTCTLCTTCITKYRQLLGKMWHSYSGTITTLATLVCAQYCTVQCLIVFIINDNVALCIQARNNLYQNHLSLRLTHNWCAGQLTYKKKTLPMRITIERYRNWTWLIISKYNYWPFNIQLCCSVTADVKTFLIARFDNCTIVCTGYILPVVSRGPCYFGIPN